MQENLKNSKTNKKCNNTKPTKSMKKERSI